MKGLLKRRATAEESRARAFKREYDDLKDRLDSIRANYDNVSDEPSIDALIYEENAVPVVRALSQGKGEWYTAGISGQVSH